MRFEQTTKEPEHRVMWNNGPTRRFSETRNSLAPMPYAIGGFVGNYVCQECDAPCQGVYLAKAGTERARQWIVATVAMLKSATMRNRKKRHESHCAL